MWKLFTEELRLAVWNGEVEAKKDRSELVETRHLLLGLFTVADKEILRVLSDLRVVSKELESRFRLQIGPPILAQVPTELHLSKNSKRAIDTMYDYATQLNSKKSLEPIHLLLGLSDVDDMTGTFLRSTGLRPAQLLRSHQRI